MSGVRLSFALSYWKTLGQKYPPAMDALVELRDRTAKQILDSGATAELFHDVAALNRTLGEDRKTVDLFLVVDKNTPELAKNCWFMVKDAVIGAKQYELAAKHIGDPELAFLRIRQSYELNQTLYKDPRIGEPSFIAFNEKRLVEESMQLISVLVAVRTRTRLSSCATRLLSCWTTRGCGPPCPSGRHAAQVLTAANEAKLHGSFRQVSVGHLLVARQTRAHNWAPPPAVLDPVFANLDRNPASGSTCRPCDFFRRPGRNARRPFDC